MASSSGSNIKIELDPAMEAALKSNLVPFQEYFLQGSIIDEEVDTLLDRLKGLCDNCDEPLETYQDHEMCFVINRVQEKPLRMRVRRSLDFENQPYMLRYVGITEAGDWSQPTAVRISIDVGTSSSVVEFMTGLGYRREFEFVSRGYIFKKGRMKCTVSKINKAKEKDGQLIVLDPVTRSYFVEMSVVVSAGKQAIGTEMKQFADCLKPLVYMDKADQFRP